MRRFIRHPSDIPIEVARADQTPATHPLRDVSHGGLCFQVAEPVRVGDLVQLRIALTTPAFEVEGRVIWCLPEDRAWQVGVEFLDPDDQFRARMVEQICHIEQYRRDQQAQTGRRLTSHEAALEWIEKFAKMFPRPGGS
jgi:Tfp pilus assembly protein PilZ